MSDTCRTCGAPITWATSPNGRALPLTKVRTLYELDKLDEGATGTRDLRARKVALPESLFIQTDRYVSHFETCPQAADWSGKKR